VGYLKDRSIVVTAPILGGRRLELIENDAVLVQGFSGLDAYAFRSFVIRVSRAPFDYVHLSFPEAVFGRPVRQSHCVRTKLDARIVANGDAPFTPVTAQIENLSAMGAVLSSTHTLNTEAPLRLSIGLVLHGNPVEVETEGSIISREAEAANDDTTRSYIVQFGDMAPHDAMLLKAYVYQQIVDCPQSVC